jgi:hypothetical protein
MSGYEHVLEQGPLKFNVVSDQSPARRITRGGEEWLRHVLSGKPRLHLVVADGVAEAEDFSG